MKLFKNIWLFCVFGSILLFAIHKNVYYKNCLRDSAPVDMISKLFKCSDKFRDMKYILRYNPPLKELSKLTYEGQKAFIEQNCSVRNCYITSKPNFLNSITDFDVILFNGPHTVTRNPYDYLPKQRSSNQSYIFVSTESSDYYYVPDFRYNKIFNYTWTYKLSSDIYYGYISIKNKSGDVIGPSGNISWLSVDDMLPITNVTKEKLRYKKKAAAWFVSNCYSHSKREKWALDIYEEFRKYDMRVDIFGECLYKQCPRNSMEKCLEMLQKDYYFYFAFENSMSDDYVTEKLLYALNNYAVPVVFGGADYRRFMPDGIYLNAREMSIKVLVRTMVSIITNKEKYYSFFKWHNHYSYHRPEESSYTDSYCEFCDFVNKIDTNKSTYVDNFYHWWNPHVAPVKTTLVKGK